MEKVDPTGCRAGNKFTSRPNLTYTQNKSIARVLKFLPTFLGRRSPPSSPINPPLTGNSISWVNKMRYLGVFFVKLRVFKCDLDHVKRPFYRAANAIFDRIGRIASEEVIIQLIKSKCIPVVYGLEVCPLTKSDLKSLDFPANRFFMKLFILAIFRWLMTVKYILVLTCQVSLLSDSLRSLCP